MSLGLRYCPNHADTPLTLRQSAQGLYWKCEHPSQCTHSENAIKTYGSKVVAVNGRRVRMGSLDAGRRGTRDSGGDSKVEKTLERTFKNRAQRRDLAATDAAVQPSTPLGTQQEAPSRV